MSFLTRNALKQASSLSRRAVSQRPAFSTTARVTANSTPVPPRPSNDNDPNAMSQSQADRVDNFKQAANEVADKMATNPESITTEDAAHIKSREARMRQQAQPPADSISAEADRLAAQNEGATNSSSRQTPGDAREAPSSPSMAGKGPQSQGDRLENFKEAVEEVGIKMDAAPQAVTQEDAAYLRSREMRAFGNTEKGGTAAQAQSLASKNEKTQ